MIKREAAFTTKLKVWMKYNLNNIPAYGWEVKYPRSKTYTFKSDKSFAKELRNLMIWYNGKVIYKFSDIARFGTMHDGFTASGKGYFFFTWNGKLFYIIEAVTIQGMADDGKKGLTEEDAKKYCIMIGSIK
jgi:hypothetical protein